MLREVVALPLQRPDLFRQFGIKPPRGVLLVGPPGTGKTLVARALAAECDARVLTISGAEVVSKYYGETEARLQAIFREAHRCAPAIILMDEVRRGRCRASTCVHQAAAAGLPPVDSLPRLNCPVGLGLTSLSAPPPPLLPVAG